MPGSIDYKCRRCGSIFPGAGANDVIETLLAVTHGEIDRLDRRTPLRDTTPHLCGEKDEPAYGRIHGIGDIVGGLAYLPKPKEPGDGAD